jgi:hypothetical protein
LGVSALSANTTASKNTAVGYEAGYTSTTAIGITAVGYKALRNNTGSRNSAFGGGDDTSYNAALGFNTTGTDSAAFGIGALAGNTTGSYNTASGVAALYNNTTASSNTAVGYQALYAQTTGGNNVAVGRSAGVAITTGSHNHCFGDYAGERLTTGSSNVLIGRLAGAHNVYLATGSDNVLVGALADTTDADVSSANVIGYDVSGGGGYTTLGNAASDIRAAHGTATWATVSDQRYKKDIADSTTGLNFINALQPRTFNYKTLGELPETFRAYKADSTEVYKSSQTQHGFIAQEIKAAIDADSSIADGFKLWDDREDGSQEVAEAALIPVLVKAIQELTARLETLEGE